jgi:hypothetical protein
MRILSTTNGIGARQSSLGSNSLQKKTKTDSLLDNLMKQKQKITESKNSLIQKTAEDGRSLQSIKPQLDGYEDQLKDIDKKIAEISFEKQKKALDADKDGASSPFGQPRTEQQAQSQQFSDIASMSGDMQKVKVMASAETKMHGQAGVLGQEIKTDEARAQSGQKAIAKRGRLAKIEDGLTAVSRKKGEALKDLGSKSNELSQSAGKASPENPGEADSSRSAIIGAYTEVQKNRPEPAEKPQLDIMA